MDVTVSSLSVASGWKACMPSAVRGQQFDVTLKTVEVVPASPFDDCGLEVLELYRKRSGAARLECGNKF